MKKTNTVFALVIGLALVGTTTYAQNTSVKSTTDIGIRMGENKGIRENQLLEKKGQNENSLEVKSDIKTDLNINKETNNRTTKDRAIQEIDRRVESLNKLDARVFVMSRVSDATKTNIKTMLNAQINTLTTLKAKIVADTDPVVLKADIASITNVYRISMLVMPQISLLTSADKITTSADLMATFGAKLETRIAEMQTAGIDVTSYNTAYTDYKAKIADAKVQAAAALSLITTIKPDNGDEAIITANKKVLIDARGKLKIAQEDLRTARKDAEMIIKGLKEKGKKEGNKERKSKIENKTEVNVQGQN